MRQCWSTLLISFFSFSVCYPSYILGRGTEETLYMRTTASGAVRQQQSPQAAQTSAPGPQRSPQWVDPDTSAPEGTRYQTFYSQTVRGDVSYLVYLPTGYITDTDKRYPVIFWLHGGGGNQRGGAGFVQRLDSAIKRGIAPEIIVILVNGLP